MINIQIALDELYPHLNHDTSRIIGALTEEAGEVQGSWNKISDGRKDKPKTVDDILEETCQLIACCMIVGKHFGRTTDQMLYMSWQFMTEKTEELSAK